MEFLFRRCWCVVLLSLISAVQADIHVRGDESKLWHYNGVYYNTFRASATLAENIDSIWPPNKGQNGYQLTTDGAGVWSWSDAEGASAGIHSMLNGVTHSDTASDVPSTGSLIYGNSDGTPLWDKIIIGAAATFFQSNGTIPIWISLSGDATVASGGVLTIASGAVDADELASTAVTPNSYTNTSLTVDADGRITSASTGDITNKLLDGSIHTDTANDNPTRGGIIVGNATPNWDAITRGQALGGALEHILGASSTDTGYRTLALAKADLNLEIGTDVQAYSANMDTDSTDDLTTSTSWSGDLGGTGSSPTVPNSSITHTLLDNDVHTDTANDIPTRGGIIIGNATPNWDAITVGQALGTSFVHLLGASSTDTGYRTVALAKDDLNLEIGTDIQAWDTDLDGLAAVSTNGFLSRTGGGAAVARTIQGTANQVTVVFGGGVTGNPVLSTPQDIHTGASPEFAVIKADSWKDSGGTKTIDWGASAAGSLVLDGVDDYVDIDGAGDDITEATGAITMWVKLSTASLTDGDEHCIFAFSNAGATEEILIRKTSTDDFYFWYRHSSSNDEIGSISITGWDSWTFVVCTWNTAGTMYVYIGDPGVGSDGSTVMTVGSITANSLTLGAVGVRAHAEAQFHDGEISDVMVWDDDLSQAECEAIYDLTRNPTSTQVTGLANYAELVSWWAFTENTDDYEGVQDGNAKNHAYINATSTTGLNTTESMVVDWVYSTGGIYSNKGIHSVTGLSTQGNAQIDGNCFADKFANNGTGVLSGLRAYFYERDSADGKMGIGSLTGYDSVLEFYENGVERASVYYETSSNDLRFTTIQAGSDIHLNGADDVYSADIYGQVISTSYYEVRIRNTGQMGRSSSSKRYKTHDYYLADDPDNFMRLKPASFFWNVDELSAEERSVKRLCLYAEDVNDIYPELAVIGPDFTPLTPEEIEKHRLKDPNYIVPIPEVRVQDYDTRGMQAIIIKEMQRNQREDETQNALIIELQARIKELEERFNDHIPSRETP